MLRLNSESETKKRQTPILFRYNIAQLEQWARDQKIEDTETKVIDTLLPIIQVRLLYLIHPGMIHSLN